MEQAGTRRTTRQIGIGALKVGGDAPVVVQSMCATRTIDIDQTVAQTHQLARAGAGIVRIALDNEKEVPALKEIRAQTARHRVVGGPAGELPHRRQGRRRTSTRFATTPAICTISRKPRAIPQKVRWLVEVAREHNLAIRIGVNCGSVAPAFLEKYPGDQLKRDGRVGRVWHCELMDELRLRPLRGVAQGFRSGQGARRQSPLRRAPSRRAASSRSHRGGAAARRHHQDPDRVREAARAAHRRHHPRLAHAAQRAQARRGRSSAIRLSRTSRAAASSRCPTSAPA